MLHSALLLLILWITKRFDSINLSLTGAMQALTPKSATYLDYDTLLPFLLHYQGCTLVVSSFPGNPSWQSDSIV